MRGKASGFSRITIRSRITPAYAGKSVRTLRNSHHDQDHPRLCGEKGSGGGAYSSCEGSPPPMRGKDAAGAFRAAAPGITPAYAGKSYPLLVTRW